ncbi:MAG: hypothetical protein K5756_05855 [Clostridiales bacterium]|nr:hypothetical protein [Clostridiales bacterium]
MKKKIIALIAVVALVAGISVLPSNVRAGQNSDVAKEAVVQTAAVKEEVAAQAVIENAEEETAAPVVTEESTEAAVPGTTAAEKAAAPETTAAAEETTAAAKLTWQEKRAAYNASSTTVAAKSGKKTNSANSVGANEPDCFTSNSRPYKVDTREKDSSKYANLAEGEKCVQTWTASVDGSEVYVEKLKIDVDARHAKTGTPDYRYAYIAIIKTTPDRIKTVDAKSVLPGYFEAPALTIAQRSGALIAVNNEMCIHNIHDQTVYLHGETETDNATVIKNGDLAQSGIPTPSLVWNNNGTWEYPRTVSTDNYYDLLAEGIENTISYTNPMIWHGQKYKLPDTGTISNVWNDYDLWQEGMPMNRYDHTLIGKIDANTYVFGITEGFGQAFLWDIFYNEIGVQDGFWCNGGHCSVMYLKGLGSINGGANGSQKRYNDPTPCITADIVAVY